MESSNNKTEVVRGVLKEKTVIRELTDVTLCIVLVLVVAINAAILIAFMVQKLRFSYIKVSPSGLFVLNLLFADTLIGVILFLDIVVFLNKIIAYPYWCNIRIGVLYTAGIGSHIALFNVVADRFVALAYTLQHRDWMTFTRSVVMVSCGWLIPVAGGIAAFVTIEGHPGLVRCSELNTFKAFVTYVLVPSNAAPSVGMLIMQYRVYLCLRRYDWDATVFSRLTRRSSKKSARILYLVATPTCIALLSYDAMILVIVNRVNHVILHLYHLTLLVRLLSLLFNPVVYSYATANIRKPVSDLCSDIKKLCQFREASARLASGSAPPRGVFIIQTDDTTRTSSISKPSTCEDAGLALP